MKCIDLGKEITTNDFCWSSIIWLSWI